MRSTVNGSLFEHGMTTKNVGGLNGSVRTDSHQDVDVADDIRLPCQGPIQRLCKVEKDNFSCGW
jgi:hypothetical protein